VPARGTDRVANVLFGARDQGPYLGDTWTFDGTTWKQACSTCSPAARFQMSTATLSNEVALFGGEDAARK
jgi:hypothetical protein